MIFKTALKGGGISFHPQTYLNQFTYTNRAKANPYDKTRTCAMLFKHAPTAIKLANLNSLAHFDKRTVESDGVFR